jgi:ubiquinone/menaquinone biosynthesis C-methylase UbiE
MSLEKDWSGIVNDFDRRQDYIVGPETNFIIAKELAKLYNLGNILELGCGNGKYTRQIIHAADYITATDLSEDMVMVTKQRLADLNNLTIEQADCYKLNYADESFDTVFMANLIHVVLKPEVALAEVERVLKKNGRLVIVSFTSDGMSIKNIEIMKKRYQEVFGAFPAHKRPMFLSDLAKLVEENDFLISKAELIGNDTKAMFLTAIK